MKSIKKIDFNLQASAMVYALFLLTVVSIIIGGLFYLSSLNRKLESTFEIEEILVNNSKSGIVYAQANFLELPTNKNVTIRLFNKGIDSVILTKQNWGAYQIITSQAVHNQKSFTKFVMVGSQSKSDLTNLYLADQGRPLSLSGKTKIEGLCHLPQTGVKRAYISGTSYEGTKLIYGQQKTSEKQLPKINSDLILQINQSSGEQQEWNNEVLNYHVPFDSITVHFISNAPIIIQNQNLSGKIIIESTDSVIISNEAMLKDIIIKSPKIIIENGFRGNIQCLATEIIRIEENVILEYPSVLSLIEIQQKEQKSSIQIAENTQIVGSVFLMSEVPNFRNPISLDISDQSIVNGFVYCNGQTELKGTVNGSIYTQSFYLKTASSAYQNHLLNAQILNNLPKEFIPIPLLEMSDQIKIVQWLN